MWSCNDGIEANNKYVNTKNEINMRMDVLFRFDRKHSISSTIEFSFLLRHLFAIATLSFNTADKGHSKQTTACDWHGMPSAPTCFTLNQCYAWTDLQKKRVSVFRYSEFILTNRNHRDSNEIFLFDKCGRV